MVGNQLLRRSVYLIALIVLLVATKFFRPSGNTEPDKDLFSMISRHPLEYTKHATCRMDCREISSAEVEDILKTGLPNRAKSDLKDSPCPTVALEGRTEDGQTIRVIFAACDAVTKVVTVIDLGKEHECYCN